MHEDRLKANKTVLCSAPLWLQCCFGMITKPSYCSHKQLLFYLSEFLSVFLFNCYLHQVLISPPPSMSLKKNLPLPTSLCSIFSLLGILPSLYPYSFPSLPPPSCLPFPVSLFITLPSPLGLSSVLLAAILSNNVCRAYKTFIMGYKIWLSWRLPRVDKAGTWLEQQMRWTGWTKDIYRDRKE